MPLTTAQKATLKTDIQGDATLNAFPNNSDGNDAIAKAYNLNASPDFWVFKTRVALDLVGQTFNASELAGLTQLNTARLQNLAAWNPAGVNPAVAPVRQFFDDVFSGAGGTNTRPALAILWRRLATRAEKLLATGTGSTGSPAVMGFEGTLTYEEVASARNS